MTKVTGILEIIVDEFAILFLSIIPCSILFPAILFEITDWSGNSAKVKIFGLCFKRFSVDSTNFGDSISIKLRA